MKKLLLLIVVLFSLNSYGQYNKFGIVDVPNMKSDQIYKQTKEWFFNTFKSAKAVIDVDIPNEKIMGKGIGTISYVQKISNISVPTKILMDIIITIDIKDGKYRYNIETPYYYFSNENLAIERSDKIMDSVWKVTPGSWVVSKKMKEEMKENTLKSIHEQNTQVKSTIDELEIILKNSIKEKKDNW